MRVRHLKWVPVITAAECTGCHRCVEACGPACLEVREGVAVLVCAGTCGSDAHCVAVCPEGAMRMEWVEMEGDRKRGRWAYGGRVWAGRLRGFAS